MADLPLIIRSVRPFTCPPSGGNGTRTATEVSDDATEVGDYLMVIGSVDYRPAIPTITGDTGVGTWATLGSASSGTTEHCVAYLAPVTADGPRSVTLDQGSGGASGLHGHLYTITANHAGDLAIARDGTSAAITGTTSPFTHTTITPAGTRDTLIVAHGQVQFSGTSDYGNAPSGMTIGGENYFNAASGCQSCYQHLTAATATGTRAQTSTPTTVSGGAGVRFLLRGTGTALSAPTGPEPGRMLLAA